MVDLLRSGSSGVKRRIQRMCTRAIPVQVVDRWLGGVDVFFIVSIGRSGTAYLARLLDGIPEALVEHEPVPEDALSFRKTFVSPGEAARYVRRFRQKDISLRVRRARVRSYGEVNSVLRRHVDALSEVFPGAKFIHLVRDGRDVVRSMMARGSLGRYDDVARGIGPYLVAGEGVKWEGLDRFERLCWYWRKENEFLRERIPRVARFEDVLSDWRSFREQILDPIGLTMAHGQWRKEGSHVQNPTERHVMPEPEEWARSRTDTFRRICGEEMRCYGYRV